MKSMIALVCVALVSRAAASGWAGPPANIALSSDGRNVLDTPEVAHAKAAHLAALAQAQSSRGYDDSRDDGSYDPRWDNEETWQQQPAAPQWNAAPQHQWNAAPQHQWNAAPAPAWNGAPAPVVDTPEVAQAKAAHLAALNAAKSAAGPASQWNAEPQHQWNAEPQQQWNAAPQHQWNAAPQHQWNAAPQQWNAAPKQWNGAPSWQAAPAPIRLSHDGQNVLDTPEVAAARAAHLQAHAQAAHGAAPAPAHNQW